MQYKIPVQIENEDPIFLGLSLRQLTIIMIGGGIAYTLFSSLEPRTGVEVAAIPSIFILLLAITIAIFKQYEMTFIPFILSLFSLNLNEKNRRWQKATDSHSALDIGYVLSSSQKSEEKIDFSSKIDKIQELNEKINKI